MKVLKNFFTKTATNILTQEIPYFALLIPGLLIFFAASLSSSPEPSVEASVSPLKGLIGQPFTYTVFVKGIDAGEIKITLPEKKTVFPEKKNPAGKEESPAGHVPLYIINSASRDDSVTGEIRLNLSLTYYRPGSYVLPEIKISGMDGINIGYKIPTVTIEETNSEGKFEEIEPPVSLSGNYSRLWWIIAAVMAGALAGFFLYRSFRKKRKPVMAAELPVPPIEIFLREVEDLKLKELIVQGRINEYVFAISIIFRRYLSMMQNFDAAEMTTDEISSGIKKFMPSHVYAACGDEIITNMRMWDLSKFAEFAPSQELLLNNLEATVSVARKIHEMNGAENVPSGI